MALAERLAAPPPARLVITHGLSGCGKTRATNERLQNDPSASTLRLRSDVERKRLAGLGSKASSGSPLDGGIYGAAAQQQTYAHLLTLASQLLRAGW